MADDTVYKFKIFLFGSRQVGRSSLFNHFGRNILDSSNTYGHDHITRIIKLDELNIKLQIWETRSGSYQMFTNYLSSLADGVIILFDVTKESSFDEVIYHLNNVKRSTKEYTKIILVGTKCDLIQERKVSFETAKAFAYENSLPYFEMNCQSTEHVEYVFVSLASRILKSH